MTKTNNSYSYFDIVFVGNSGKLMKDSGKSSGMNNWKGDKEREMIGNRERYNVFSFYLIKHAS